MSSKIRVLDENTINKIAAGEVIENPASVVKELVENSIDAGATEITVEIKGGGRQLIRITDNGCGMNHDDALLCFERHATSKIKNIHDIHAIGTMGFRGEAVPSIASISKATLLTNHNEEENGTLILVDGGRIVSCNKAVRGQGTTFEIKSLFFNVPVRKKFQRSPSHDTNEILKTLTMQALAHPNIAFQLINNQKTALSVKPLEDAGDMECLGQRILGVLGKEYFAGLHPIEKEHQGYKITGYIGLPFYTRHNRTGQYLFINKRAVFSPLISYAVKGGYGTSIAPNRHPLYVLYLTCDGSLVDVNVHPQKREVRLRQEYQLKEMITFSVEEALQTNTPAAHASEAPFPEIRFPEFDREPPAFVEPERLPPYPPFSVNFEAPKENPSPEPAFLPLFEEPKKEPHAVDGIVVASVPGFLILSTHSGALTLLDQRAAHSRILYEQLLDSEKNRASIPVQTLLIPYTFELEPVDAALLKEHLSMIRETGLDIDVFGDHSFIIQSVPQIFGNVDLKDVLREILEDLRRLQKEDVILQEVKKRIAQSASRASIPKYAKLSPAEGQSLYRQLMKCASPYHCPFGKHTMIEMTQQDIAKQFQK